MNNFSTSTRLVLQILAVSLVTSIIPVQAMQQEEQKQDVFARELEALNNTDKKFEVTEHNMPHLHAMVQDLSGTLGIDVPKIYVVRNDSVNGQARGGFPWDSSEYIQLNTGVLTKRSNTEIEFITAHELSHIKLKHATRIFHSILKLTPILLITIFFTRDINNVTDIFGPYTFGFLLFVFSFSRECEKEADLLAVKSIGRSDGALSNFNKSLVECPLAKFIPSFLSTHPDDKTRIQYVTEAFQQ